MHLKNDAKHFGLLAIVLHWFMAVLIIGLLGVGLYMVDLPISAEKLKLYGQHKEFGLLVLALVILRLFWRFINTTPQLNIPLWEAIAARAAHWALYIFMFAMPITGWLQTSAAGLPPSFFGLFTLPSLVAPNEDLRSLFATIHEWLAYGLIATICLHTAAALKHHFIDKDDILKRMIS
ncbi:MAG: cytochrome b [Legionella sp.]|jgi:cytochrome b561